MNKTLVLLLAMLLLTACAGQSEEEIQKRIDIAVMEKEGEIRGETSLTQEKEEKKMKDELFQKNIECQKHKLDVEKKFNSPEDKVRGVFYSPKVNSCIYATQNASLLEGKLFIMAFLADVFTDVIYEQHIGYETDMSWKIEDKIQEYQQFSLGIKSNSIQL